MRLIDCFDKEESQGVRLKDTVGELKFSGSMKFSKLLKLNGPAITNMRAKDRCKLLTTKRLNRSKSDPHPTFRFKVRCGEDWSRPVGWATIQLDRSNPDTPIEECDIKVTCDCPYWCFYGSRYWAYHEDYALLPKDVKVRFREVPCELVPPDIRDKHGERYACKHIIMGLLKLSDKEFQKRNFR